LNIEKDFIEIVAYFTVALKVLKLGENVSNEQKKKITGMNSDTHEIAGYLIGQIGKNSKASAKIKGDELLNLAENVILEAYDYVGGRVVFLECEEAVPLTSFYEKNGYKRIPRAGDDDSNLALYVKRIK